MTDPKAGFPPVRHQRVMWNLPPGLPEADALRLRAQVREERTGTSMAIEPGEEQALFTVLVPDGGSFAMAVGVKLKRPSP